MAGFEKPRILIFIGSLRAGGKERRLIELLTYLNERDLFEILLVMTKGEIHYVDFWKLDIECKVLEKNRKKMDLTIFSRFYKLCRQFNPHIIHAWGRMQAFYTIPAIIGQNRILINSQITGAPTQLEKWTIDRLIDIINFRFSTSIVANSKKGFEVFSPPLQKRKLILNGINLSRFENLPPADVVKRKYRIHTKHAVVMLASFTPAKDYNLFFNVASKVNSIRDDISFIGVGGYDKDDSEFERMKELSADHPRIIFQGEIHDAEAVVNVCSIGVLFSTNGEGTSNSILEYMALGKPVIATNSGGTAELITNGENGYLVDNSSPDQISNLILGLIDYPEKAASFGSYSKKKIKDHFSIERMGEAFKEVYNEALSYQMESGRIEQSVLTNKH